MRITQLSLCNFRCFQKLNVVIPDHFALLIGNNGSGKTSVLDGIVTGLSGYFRKMEGSASKDIQNGDVRALTFNSGSTMEQQPQYPVSIGCAGLIFGKSVNWERSRNTSGGKTTYGKAADLDRITEEMTQRVRTGDASVILPVIAYYRTNRLWAGKKMPGIVSRKITNRFSGYQDCLDAAGSRDRLYEWFRKMTYQELQENQPIPELSAVKKAVITCFNSSGNREIYGEAVDCRFGIRTEDIELVYRNINGESELVYLSQLSDGYRNMLSLVADIAFRMAQLNPQLLDRALVETDGIVLIDEIDLHIHPAWQRQIVHTLQEIFPRVQFIATTHAPSVISSVQKESIVVLENYAARQADQPTYGKDSNAILQMVMDVPERPDDVRELISQLHDDLINEEYSSVEARLKKLKQILGENDPEVVRAESVLALETMEL